MTALPGLAQNARPSCTHMSTVGVKGLSTSIWLVEYTPRDVDSTQLGL